MDKTKLAAEGGGVILTDHSSSLGLPSCTGDASTSEGIYASLATTGAAVRNADLGLTLFPKIQAEQIALFDDRWRVSDEAALVALEELRKLDGGALLGDRLWSNAASTPKGRHADSFRRRKRRKLDLQPSAIDLSSKLTIDAPLVSSRDNSWNLSAKASTQQVLSTGPNIMSQHDSVVGTRKPDLLSRELKPANRGLESNAQQSLPQCRPVPDKSKSTDFETWQDPPKGPIQPQGRLSISAGKLSLVRPCTSPSGAGDTSNQTPRNPDHISGRERNDDSKKSPNGKSSNKADNTWNPDVPILSVEACHHSLESTFRVANDVTLSRTNGDGAQKDCTSDRSFLSNVGSKKGPIVTANETARITGALCGGSQPSQTRHYTSLFIALATAVCQPSQRSSIARLIARLEKPSIRPEIPAVLRRTFDALAIKFNKDDAFLTSTIVYIMERLEASEGILTEGAEENNHQFYMHQLRDDIAADPQNNETSSALSSDINNATGLYSGAIDELSLPVLSQEDVDYLLAIDANVMTEFPDGGVPSFAYSPTSGTDQNFATDYELSDACFLPSAHVVDDSDVHGWDFNEGPLASTIDDVNYTGTPTNSIGAAAANIGDADLIEEDEADGDTVTATSHKNLDGLKLYQLRKLYRRLEDRHAFALKEGVKYRKQRDESKKLVQRTRTLYEKQLAKQNGTAKIPIPRPASFKGFGPATLEVWTCMQRRPDGSTCGTKGPRYLQLFNKGGNLIGTQASKCNVCNVVLDFDSQLTGSGINMPGRGSTANQSNIYCHERNSSFSSSSDSSSSDENPSSNLRVQGFNNAETANAAVIGQSASSEVGFFAISGNKAIFVAESSPKAYISPYSATQPRTPTRSGGAALSPISGRSVQSPTNATRPSIMRPFGNQTSPYGSGNAVFAMIRARTSSTPDSPRRIFSQSPASRQIRQPFQVDATVQNTRRHSSSNEIIDLTSPSPPPTQFDVATESGEPGSPQESPSMLSQINKHPVKCSPAGPVADGLSGSHTERSRPDGDSSLNCGQYSNAPDADSVAPEPEEEDSPAKKRACRQDSRKRKATTSIALTDMERTNTALSRVFGDHLKPWQMSTQAPLAQHKSIIQALPARQISMVDPDPAQQTLVNQPLPIQPTSVIQSPLAQQTSAIQDSANDTTIVPTDEVRAEDDEAGDELEKELRRLMEMDDDHHNNDGDDDEAGDELEKELTRLMEL
ncbi:MAG: hypothetical protein M1818_008337 [Claussenomyces sp. TS43310]|nr:MAG: hypothetical protein M1818_008337 [Claussenomyces sp. TS43310]